MALSTLSALDFFTHLTPFRSFRVRYYFYPILQLRQWMPREVKKLSQSDTAVQSWVLNPGSLTLEFVFLTTP